MATYFKKGEWNACCDECGFEYKSGQIRQDWRGLRVCFSVGTNNCWDPRHPQEFVRGVKDRQDVPWTRVCGPMHFRPNAYDDCYPVTAGGSVAANVLENDVFTDLATITFLTVPAASVGVFKYTDAASAEQTVVAGTPIAAADFNSPTFEADASVGTLNDESTTYRITDSRGSTADASVKLTATASLSAPPVHNIFFGVDASDAATSVNSAMFISREDVNGDTKSPSSFDASLVMINDILTQLLEDGLPASSRVQIASFESQDVGDVPELEDPTILESNGQTVFTADTLFRPIYDAYDAAGTPFGDNNSLVFDQGRAYYVPVLQAARAFFDSQGAGSNNRNILFLLGFGSGPDQLADLDTETHALVNNNSVFIETIALGGSVFDTAAPQYIEISAAILTQSNDHSLYPTSSTNDFAAYQTYIEGLSRVLSGVSGPVLSNVLLENDDNLVSETSDTIVLE